MNRDPHHHVAGISGGHTGDDRTLGQLGGQVLGGMDGDVGAAVEDGSLDLGHEQTRAVDVGERSPVAVTRGRHHLQLHVEAGVVLGQLSGDQLGLAQRQAGAAVAITR